MTDDPDVSADRGASRDLDRAGTTDHLDNGPARGRFWSGVAWLLDNWAPISLGLGVLAVVCALAFDVTVPRSAHVIALSTLVSALLIGRPMWGRVKSLLWSPNKILLVDLDAADREGAAWLIPAETFRSAWSVTDGGLDWLSPNLAVGKSVDATDRTVTGTWRGTRSDAELLRAIETIELCRGDLEADARKGRRLDSQAFVVVRQATHAATQRLLRTFEAGTLPDEGDGIDSAIDAVLDDLGMERSTFTSEDDDDLDDGPASELDLDLSGATDPRQEAAGD